MQAVNHKEELATSIRLRDARAKRISELQEQNKAAFLSITQRERMIDKLFAAQEIENRIIAQLNYLAQYPSDDRSALLKQERLTQQEILAAIGEL